MHKPPIHIDQQLLNAYEQTHYELPTLQLSVRVGQRCAPLEAYLRSREVASGAFVTAYNPQSQARSEAENTYWQRTLITELEEWHRDYLPALHRDPHSRWPDEASCFILALDAKQAIALGRRYGQYAVVDYTLGQGARLCWCH